MSKCRLRLLMQTQLSWHWSKPRIGELCADSQACQGPAEPAGAACAHVVGAGCKVAHLEHLPAHAGAAGKHVDTAGRTGA